MPEQEKYYSRDRGRDLRLRPIGAKRRRFEVSEMHALHKEISRRKVLGQKNVHIAKALGVSDVMVSYTVNSPNVQDDMDIKSGARDAETMDLKKEIRGLAPKAFENLQTIIHKGKLGDHVASLALIAKESNNILDRELGRPTQTVKGLYAHAVYTAQDIEAIKRRAESAGDMINVTPA